MPTKKQLEEIIKNLQTELSKKDNKIDELEKSLRKLTLKVEEVEDDEDEEDVEEEVEEDEEEVEDEEDEEEVEEVEYKLVDLFAGTGAFSHVFEKLDKIKCVYANDYCNESEAIFNLNHDIKLVNKDLNTIDVSEIPSHDILCGGFPCFTKDTKVLTYNGYKNIQDVNLNDRLLTHNGDFKKILNLQTKYYNNLLYHIKVFYSPYILNVTKEHPFYVNRDGIIGWINTKDLTENDYVGLPINTKNIIPIFTFEKKVNQFTTKDIKITLDNKDYWFMMGYFVGDGWIEETQKKDGRCMNKIRFAINNDDEEYVLDRIRTSLPITDKKCSTGKCKKFGCADFLWFNILKQFGKYAHGKLIPEWVQDAPIDLIKEFIKGYKTADGCIYRNRNEIVTTSYNLAFSIQRLLLKTGIICSLNYKIRPETYIIEGRKVNQRNFYKIIWGEKNYKGFIKNNYMWRKINSIEKIKVENEKVYNFEVEDDNSYCVENIIVHNCQPFSIAGKKLGFKDKRGNIFHKVVEIIDHHKPRFVILENVKNLKGHDKGNTFKVICKKLIDCGYKIKYQILNTYKLTGIPQNRERIYIVCFKNDDDYDKFNFDFSEVSLKPLSSCLEVNIPDKYYYSDRFKVWPKIKEGIVKHINTNTVYQYRRHYMRENKNNVSPTLTANMGSGGHNVPLILDDKGIRKLTPRECFNLQGFPEDYKLPDLSDSRLYKLAGNAVSVPVVELLSKKICDIIE